MKQPSLTDKLLSAPAVLCIFIATGVLSLAALLSAPFDRKKKFYLLLTQIWGRIIFGVTRIRVHLHGLEHIERGRTYIVAANHQSYLDIPATLGYLPLPLRMLAKKELLRIPLFGWAMLAGGHMSLDRGSPRESLKMIRKAGEDLRCAEASVMVYPEGTRSPDGRIYPFKRGAFHLAAENNLPVLPVAIKGSRDALPKGRNVIMPGRIDVIVGAPIFPEGKGVETIRLLTERTYAAVVELFERGE